MTFAVKRALAMRALVLLILSFVMALPSFAAQVPAIGNAANGSAFSTVVMPLSVYGQDPSGSIRRDVMEALATSIEAEGVGIAGMAEIKEAVEKKGQKTFSEAEAIAIARMARADFAVVGSITVLGGSIDVNIRIVSVDDGAVSYHAIGAGAREDVVKGVRNKAREIYSAMKSSIDSRPVARSGIIDRVVITGNRRVDAEAIRKRLKSAKGSAYSQDDVRDDLQAIYGMGYFDDVRAELLDAALGKTLSYTVREKPFIKAIVFEGNEELKQEKLAPVLTIKERTALDMSAVWENAERIRTLYMEDGLYLAEVAPAVDKEGLDATVTFKISEGQRVRVRSIVFIGNERFDEEELKDLMQTEEAGLFSFITDSGRFDEALFENDLAVILNNYYDNGYIQAEVTEKRVLLSEDKLWFNITVAVKEGPQFKVGSIEVSGDLLKSRDELVEKFGVEPGEVFSRTNMFKGIDAIATLYGDEGYAFADIRPKTDVDAENKEIHITLELRKNELVYIERLDVSGNTKTRDKVVRREVELDEGELFNASALKRSSNNLRRLGYFEDVNVSHARAGGPDRARLDVSVKERPTGSVSAGLGYSSVDKLVATAQISQSNLMGTGIKLDLSGTISASSNKYILGITEPWFLDRHISAGFDVYNTGKAYPDFEMNKNGFDVRFGFSLFDRYTRANLTYKLEDVVIFEVSSDASSYIQAQEGESTESSVKFGVKRDTRNDAFFPSNGEVLSGSIEVAGGALGGSSYFIKYEADAVKYFEMPWETVFSLRGSIGFLQEYAGVEPPIYERYFLGGINSIRGFEARSVGPIDWETGDLIGGDSMVVFNAEYLFPLFSERSLRGLVFFDAGNAFDGTIDFSDLRYGAGFGIRWFSPMGPLRLELGFNLNRRNDEKPQQWEFAIGSVF